MTSGARSVTPAHSASVAAAMMLLLLTPLLLGWSWGRAWWKSRQGNRFYAQAQELERQHKPGEAVKKYKEAVQCYRDALADDPTAPGIPLNIGNVYYKQRKFKEALKEYEKVLQGDDALLQAKAHYNIGNCHFQQGDFVKAIESYKRALDLNPDDRDAKYNLELARQRLKDLANKQEQQQKQKQKNQTRSEKQCKRPQGAGSKPQTQQKQQKGNAAAQKKQKGQSPKEKGNQQPQRGKKAKTSAGKKKPVGKAKAVKMSREEAERLLRSLEADEKEAMKQSLRLPVPDNPEYHGADY